MTEIKDRIKALRDAFEYDAPSCLRFDENFYDCCEVHLHPVIEELERLQAIEIKYRKAQKSSKLAGASVLTKLDLIMDALTED